jgi:hypothetical protein
MSYISTNSWSEFFTTTTVQKGHTWVRQGVARILAGWSAYLSSIFCKFLVGASGSTWTQPAHPLAPLWIRARHWNRNGHLHWIKNHTKRDSLIQWFRLRLHVRWTGIQNATAFCCRDEAVTVITHTFQWLQTVKLTGKVKAGRAWANLQVPHLALLRTLKQWSRVTRRQCGATCDASPNNNCSVLPLSRKYLESPSHRHCTPGVTNRLRGWRTCSSCTGQCPRGWSLSFES